MNLKLDTLFAYIGEATQNAVGPAADEHIQKLNRQFAAAGQSGEAGGVEMLGKQMVSLVAFPAIWLFIFSQVSFMSFMFQGSKQFFFYLAMMAFGFFFPTLKTKDVIKTRQENIALALPDTVDLLTISVEAGLDFTTALRRVVDKQKDGPLKQELERFFRQMELGRTRRIALKEMADRVQLNDLSNTCSALIQADRLGSSIGPVLRMQSDMLRVRRMQRAEKRAMEAPVKMMAPLLMCIFPAVFVVMFAPLFIQMIRDLMAG